MKDFHKTRKQETTGTDNVCTKVAMRKDLTPLQRKTEDSLFRELKNKREEAQQSGDDKARWVRRNGRIVNLAAKLPSPGEGGER